MCNFIFVGDLVILTENVKERRYAAIDGTEATIKSSTFKVEKKKGQTKITAVEAVTDAGHKWDSYPECYCQVIAEGEMSREEIKKMILASRYVGSLLRLYKEEELATLGWREIPPVFINKRGEVETRNGSIIKY
jgi:hypothetical protein